MVQKITLLACLLCLLFASCGEAYIECEKEEVIYLSLADNNWALDAQRGSANSAWISNTGFSQSAALVKKPIYYSYYSNKLVPPIKLDIDKCRRYVALPLQFTFTPSIYPVQLGFDILHNPFTKNIQVKVSHENTNGDYDNQFFEEVLFSIVDSALSTESKFSKYELYYDSPELLYSKATFFSNFTGISGRTFSNVYKVPLEAFRLVKTKSSAIRLVWIAKEIGIVQYEMADGLIWCMK
ncbi:MAG: hypothetical protein CFE21_06895 [Bacteroidetes bacterium B1(2017)]|nr:MAG: hypothetical protein CFE21_06895 [Bacteroidetes bacterium B1(2017)]